ncbi:NACHT, LRR and PYD domains-containing protein 3-like isoform X2 [Alosa pseudoharengus]|uniref:NACHT, LRR and PYD domains-containing protein 3-like isoform X2 n=1 Tax=Alosa pseudoharengus TaxID=34774 RepID=UPI003F8B7EF2
MSVSQEREEAAGLSETLRPESAAHGCGTMKNDMAEAGSTTHHDARPQTHRPPSPVPSCVSMKSDKSMDYPPKFSNEPAQSPFRPQTHRPPSPVPSCVSMKSDKSMDYPPKFSNEPAPSGLKPQTHRPPSPVPSCVSMKSDKSMDYPPKFSNEPAPSGLKPQTHRPPSPVPSCVSMKSDKSMDYPPKFSNEPAPSGLKPQTHRPPSPVPSCVSMKSDKSMDYPPKFSNEPAPSGLKPETHRPPSPVPSCVSMKSDRSMDYPPKFSNEPAPSGLTLLVHQRGQHQVDEEDEEARAHTPLQEALGDHKSSMQKRFECICEGLEQRKLNKIYTQLYITEGESDDVNNEHEIIQMDKLSRNTPETPIDCNDIFKALPGQGRHIRTVMTKGIAGIGKTVSVHKFILDWADAKTNQEVHLLLFLPFRELNLLKHDEFTLHNLLLMFHPELAALSVTCYHDLQVVFIFDGIDESKLPLNFQTNKPVGDVMETATLDMLVTNLIKGNLLRSARIWMTSRPAAAGQIPSEYVDRITEVRGFENQQKEDYFMKRIDDQDRAWEIISYIKVKRSLYIMCHIPVFCYIAATVLQDMLGEYDSAEIPSTLTEMYIYFLIIQLEKKKQKYDGVKPERKNVLEANRDAILKLAKLAFKNLEQGTILFDEEGLNECGINLEEASVHSGFCTEILREEPKFALRKFYCFVHLSLQEFLAALFVFVSFMNEDMAALESFLKVKPKKVFLYLLLKSAVEKSLQSKNGHWDLFLRFLLGISLESSQKLLEGLLTRPLTKNKEENSKSLELIVKHLKGVDGKNISPDRFINLINCLSEMKDLSLQDELQCFISYEKLPETELSPAHCSALADALLKSADVLDEFDIDKYNTTEDGCQRFVPVIKWCRKAWLTDCKLKEESCEIMASVLQSSTSHLRELHLDGSTMPDSGMKAVFRSLTNPSCMLERLRQDSRLVDLDLTCCSIDAGLTKMGILKVGLKKDCDDMKVLKAGLMNPHCKVKRLSLRKCSLSSSHCEDVASILCSSASSLMELDLRDNDLQDSGVELLSSALQNSQCTLEILRLSASKLTEASWRSLTSVFQGELDLSESRLLMSELEQLSAALRSPDCRVNTLRLKQCFLKDDHCGVLASVLSSDRTHLKELDLSDNDLQDSGVELLSSGLQNSQCTLEILRLSFCGVTEKGCEFLASALSANPSYLRELDLSYNHPGDTGVKLLSERKDCKLDTLIVDHDAECWLKSGLKKYAHELKLDPDTANYVVSISENQQKLTTSDESYPDHPDRIKSCEQVLCSEGLTGRCYWEAEWKFNTVYVGAAYRKQGMKERDCRLGLNDTSWGLLCHHSSNLLYQDTYTASHERKASPKVSLTFDCNRVGVFLDWPAGTLSFYSVTSDTLTHLHTFHHRFTEPLCPGFGFRLSLTSRVTANEGFISLCRV